MMPMKGLLKGLRYISQIFDNEKEEEIHIGLPTDVKHVAHIGMDGPSANTPSWMNKYSANPETSPVPPNSDTKHRPSTKSPAEDPVNQNIREPLKSPSGSLDSPTKRSSSKTRQSRRNHSQNNSAGSGDGDGDSFNLSKPRRHKLSDETGSPKSERTRRVQNQNTNGSDSPSNNPPRVPKSRRKKSKESSGSGSMKSPRTKGTDPIPESSPFSDPGPEPGFKNIEVYSNTVHREGNECEEIPRRNHAV